MENYLEKYSTQCAECGNVRVRGNEWTKDVPVNLPENILPKIFCNECRSNTLKKEVK
ncbi:MAG: hypothetical protein V1910_02190 [bacterium]